MTDVRFAVCCRRAIIEHVSRIVFAVLHTFFEDLVFFPEFFYLFFTIYKIQVRIYFLIHNRFLL